MEKFIANLIKFVFEQMPIFREIMQKDRTISRHQYEFLENTYTLYQVSSIITCFFGISLFLFMFIRYVLMG